MHLKKKSEEDLERAKLEWVKTVEHYAFQFGALSSEYELLKKHILELVEIPPGLKIDLKQAYEVAEHAVTSRVIALHSGDKVVEDFIANTKEEHKEASEKVNGVQRPKSKRALEVKDIRSKIMERYRPRLEELDEIQGSSSKEIFRRELDHHKWLNYKLSSIEEGTYFLGRGGGKAILEIDILYPLPIIISEVSKIIEAKKKELYSKDPKLELLGKPTARGGRSLENTMVSLWDRRLRALKLKDDQGKTYNEIAEIICKETGETVTYNNARDYVRKGRKDIKAALAGTFP